jgi:hypothetical protein
VPTRLKLCAIAVAFFSTVSALAADRPVVVELFTSEGCSSCPPADAYLTELARNRPDVLALGFHVTYWNNLGWPDPFSLQAATDRQSSYAEKRKDTTVFTPELVVDGAESVVGSNVAEASAAIRRAQSRAVTAASIRATKAGREVVIDVGAGSGRGTLVLVGFDPEHRTAVTRGENRGRTLLESNIVRSIRSIGSWSGAPLSLKAAAPAGEAGAVLLQAPSGQIIGAARVGVGSS